MYALANFATLGTGLAFADPTALDSTNIQTIIGDITSQISVSSVVSVIGAVLGVTVGFGFLWWGARYGIRKLMGAIKKGRVG